MLHDPIAPGSAGDWLRHAKSDLDLAGIDKPQDVLWESLCFHAQQAAEKALKALLVHNGIEIPRTHNIRILIEMIPREIRIPDLVEAAAMLTDYSVTSRYPGDYQPVTITEYEESLKLARLVYEWVSHLISE